MKQSTLTEQELLSRYQTMFNDEDIDYDLLLSTVTYICQSSLGDGGILIFFPGWMEISEFTNLLEATPPFSDGQKYKVLQQVYKALRFLACLERMSEW